MRAKPPSTLITTILRPLTLTHQVYFPPTPLSLLPPFHRTLTTTPPLAKKGGKQNSKRTVPLNASKAQSESSSSSEPVNAFDFSDYTAAIQRAHERLKAELSKVKAGGRSAEEIEGVRVSLGGKRDREGGEGRRGGEDGAKSAGGKNGSKEGEKGQGKGKMDVRLGDVASVVARGRNVGVLVGEKEHLKPILSSLASVPSLTYTTSPTDPLTITIAIPPVTAESRLAAKKQADKKGEEALFALREARGAQRKRHRRMELGRLVVPDELRRAEREVERMNEGAVGEARGLVEGCRRGLEGG